LGVGADGGVGWSSGRRFGEIHGGCIDDVGMTRQEVEGVEFEVFEDEFGFRVFVLRPIRVCILK